MEGQYSKLNKAKKSQGRKLEMGGGDDRGGLNNMSQFYVNSVNTLRLKQIRDTLKPSAKIPMDMATGLNLVQEMYDNSETEFELKRHPNLSSDVKFFSTCLETGDLTDEDWLMNEDSELIRIRIRLNIRDYLFPKRAKDIATLKLYLLQTDEKISNAFELSRIKVQKVLKAIDDKLSSGQLILDISEFEGYL